MFPKWNNHLLNIVEKGELTAFGSWTPEWMARERGNSVHEVHTWIAGFAVATAVGRSAL